jgi:Phosphotransferase enzyme family
MEGTASLRDAVAVVVGRRDVVLQDVRREAFDYDAFLAGRTLNRVRGAAVTGDGTVSWSLIEKVTEGPQTAAPYLVDNARRELAFYTSDLPTQLSPSVRSARPFGSLVEPDGRITLWLEDVRDDGPRPLHAETIVAAARDLGEFAGRWLHRPLTDPWLFAGWIERHSQPEAMTAGLAELCSANPAALPGWGSRLAEAQRLVRVQPALRQLLESVPQTLCHHDAVGANLFRVAGRTVLIDWESVGPGPVGADLASLLFSSARRGDASATVVAAIFDAAFDAYVEGLRTSTEVVDVAIVRRGVDAAVALRWKLAFDVAAAVRQGTPMRRGSAPQESPQQAAAELSVLVQVLLDAAERVRSGGSA